MRKSKARKSMNACNVTILYTLQISSIILKSFFSQQSEQFSEQNTIYRLSLWRYLVTLLFLACFWHLWYNHFHIKMILQQVHNSSTHRNKEWKRITPNQNLFQTFSDLSLSMELEMILIQTIILSIWFDYWKLFLLTTLQL